MRVTFLLPHAGLSGGTRVVAVYAAHLVRRGHEVTVVSVPPARPRLRHRLRSLLLRHPVREISSGSTYFEGSGVDHRVLDKRRAVTADDVPDADVVIATWWETVEWMNDFPASKGVKLHFVQGYDPGSYTVGVSRDLADRVLQAWTQPFPKVVISTWLQEKVRENGGQVLDCIPNSVDLELFNAPVRGKQAVPTVGFVYSRTPIKGADIMSAAVCEARKRVENLRVVAFGATTPAPGMLPDFCDFHLRPNQSEIRALYAACDAWLFASREEGFGLPIVEAMACRTPVLASCAGAARELLAPGGGRLMERNDPAELANLIVWAAGLTDADWREMSQRARQSVEAYTWDDAADRLQRVLERCVNAGHNCQSATR